MRARTATILAAALCAAWGGLIAAPREGAPLPASPPAAPARAPAAFPQAAGVPPVAVDGALVQRYCVGCHNARLQTGGLDLQSLDLADIASHADVWEKVVRKVARNMMPPAGAPKPDAETLSAFVVALETALDRSAPSNPPADPPLLHRFNRVEYANAIRDLLALEVDAAALLPPDDSSFGFDNIAAVLGMSPLLMERYVSAAERISALAVGDPEVPVAAQVYRLAMDDTQNDRMPGLPLGTRGGTTVRHVFPAGGEYLIRVKLWKTSVGFVKGLQTEHQLEVSVDGRQVLLAPVGGRSDYQMNVLTSGAGVEKVLDARLRRRMEVEAGPHDVTVTFLAIAGGTRTGPEGLRPTMFAQDPLYIQGMPAIESFIIEGPYDANGAGGAATTPSRQAIFSCRPASAADEDTCARSILARLARQAYRRPVTEADLDVLLGLYRDGRGDGDFERGIQLALEGILTSPYFLFRAQQQAPGAQATAAPAGAFELASRLSFFLWSSLPDERLLELASAGTLHQPAILEQEVRRMLADPKAAALIDNFGGQWLHLRNLDALVPDRVEFPEFNGHIKDAMRRETELFLDSVLRGDRSVLDLLSADYTFVNEPLARHYGLSGVYGQEFRRVTVQDPARRGLLGHASILAVTSFPNRTSPVNRGRFVLENFMGAPPPPPPPDVPPLASTAKPTTMRERMAAHRANPVCASCHRVMDPIGLSLENFDATGAWRTRDGGRPIDARDTLADGTTVAGVADLREALLRDPDVFVGTLTEKLMTYALGRGLDYRDMPAVRAVVRDAAASGYRASALIAGIVKSAPFLMPPAEGSRVPRQRARADINRIDQAR